MGFVEAGRRTRQRFFIGEYHKVLLGLTRKEFDAQERSKQWGI
jgi:hypothetical protein